MKFSIKRVKALVKKDFIDFPKNINISLMSILPLVLVLFLSNVQRSNSTQLLDAFDLLILGLNTNLVIASTMTVSMLITEEKEKKTIKTLMFCAVTPLEFLAGKAIITLLFSMVSNMAIFFLSGMNHLYFGSFLFWSFILVVIMLLIGAVIGLFAKNQMSISVLGVPVIFAFMLIPLMAQANPYFETIASVLPNYNFGNILNQLILGNENTDLATSFFIILAWVILTSVAFVYSYKKKKLDF